VLCLSYCMEGSLRVTMSFPKRLTQCRFPVLDFLVPSLARSTRPIRYISGSRKASSAGSTTSHNSDNEATPNPSRTLKAGQEAATNAAPVKKPLTKAQRDFLASAVSTKTPAKSSIENRVLTEIQFPATSQPSRGASRNPHLRLTNTTHRSFTSTPPTPNEAHARPRSRTLQDLQRAAGKAPRPTNGYVPNMVSHGFSTGLGNRDTRAGGRNGVYRSGGDGDWGPL